MADEAELQALKQAIQDAAQSAQNAKQLAQDATQSAQNAKQVAQQISEAITQLAAKLSATTAAQTTGAGVFTREELGDIGGTESIEAQLIKDLGILFLNHKHMFDSLFSDQLESIKRNRTHIDVILSNAEANNQKVESLKQQAIQNAVENANMIAKNAIVNLDNLQKQHTAHRDIATDRTWNVDEQGYTAASILDAMNSPAMKQTMTTIVAEILAAMAAKTTPTPAK